MQIQIISQHVRPSAQAIPLAAGSIKAALPAQFRQTTTLTELYPGYEIEATATKLLNSNPALIAFSLYLWNRLDLLALAREIRLLRPEIILVAGGPEASADSRHVLVEGNLDAVICGEGEEVFAALIEDLHLGKKLKCRPGLLTADSPAFSVTSVACVELEQLPSPWLSGVLPLAPDCGVLWEVARGCQFNCAFCYDAKGHKGVRPLPFSRLRQELELFSQQGVGQVWVLDSSFNAPAQRGKQLLKLLLEVAPEIHYHIEAKSEYLDDETIELLSQFSCSVQIGLQSARQEVLKPLHRHLDHQKMTRQMEQLSFAGITFGLDLIYGLPGDNHQGFCASIDFALELQPNQVDIFPLSILPGTEIYANQDGFGIFGTRQPPYLQTENRSYSANDFEASRNLAAAADIFYNRGRAVGFFRQLTTTLNLKPHQLLDRFYLWMKEVRKVPREQILAADCWQPEQILPLQIAFCHSLSEEKQQNLKLQTLIEDLIHFNYCCAEILLAGECLPGMISRTQRRNPNQRFILSPQVQLCRFHFDLEELAELADFRLDKLVRQLTRHEGYGIFLQQGGKLVMETLDDQFAGVLNRADCREGKTLSELTARLDKTRAKEMVEFALNQGLLICAL